MVIDEAATETSTEHTRIDYQGRGSGESLVLYCVESPAVVLGKLYGQARIYSFKKQDKLLTPNWPGLVLNTTDHSTPGTTITGSIDELNFSSSSS